MASGRRFVSPEVFRPLLLIRQATLPANNPATPIRKGDEQMEAARVPGAEYKPDISENQEPSIGTAEM